MPFPPKLLNEGEDIVLDLRPHPIALAFPILVLVGALLFGILVLFASNTAFNVVALVVIVVALVYFVAKALGWSRTMFVLTTRRILTRRGVLTKSGIEFPLERINTVFFNQRFYERLLGAGDLTLESASESGNERFENVRQPDVVQREIYVQMEANENRKYDRMGSGSAGLSAAEQVEKLHELVTKGAITPAQFEAEKARLLGG